ncbi:hypothetical protein O181_048403 [Austropuccinia psidii MF-1]|uniref:Aquaporin n=1 Tax=Austropuccinia psidii MF-1 TaxID=1389203 RepID=A0A9Q3HKG4_9BASI|nr:hypothetical protein [Austropuccinia psidii MF-1]
MVSQRNQQQDSEINEANGYFYHFTKDGPLFQNLKVDFIAASGEFMGTVMFLLIGLGAIQAANIISRDKPDPFAKSKETFEKILLSLYASSSMGLSLLFSCWVFFRATGAAFNPNVSFALLLVGIISPARFILYCFAQFSASIVACLLLRGLLPGPLDVSTKLRPGTNAAQGLFIEGFITCALVLSVLFLAAEKHRATYLAPLGIGLTLFACHLFAVAFTGASMNTARSFGPAVVTTFSTEHWIYWLGPTFGSLLAVGIYAFEKRFKYWRVNQGQDTDIPSESPDIFMQNSAPNPAATKEQAALNQAPIIQTCPSIGHTMMKENKALRTNELTFGKSHVEEMV